jgi:tol-pal system protein YbgF
MIKRFALLASAVATIAGAAIVTVPARPAFAQSDEDRRLDRLDKQVRELRAILFQGRDTGQPVVVKPEGPDPEVTALQQRVSDLDDTIRKLNGQIEVLTHDSDEARAAANAVRDQNGELRGELKDLSDRVSKLESALAPAPPPAPPQGAQPGQPDQTPPPGQTGVLTLPPGVAGAPPAGPDAAPSAPTAAETYKHARALLNANDYPAAAAAFQAFIGQYPASKEIPAAYYWLGEADSARRGFADAVPAYANALKGWPKQPWAPDATVKLARALAETSQTDKACAALAEFERRYRKEASPTVKARAADVRTRAACAG